MSLASFLLLLNAQKELCKAIFARDNNRTENRVLEAELAKSRAIRDFLKQSDLVIRWRDYDSLIEFLVSIKVDVIWEFMFSCGKITLSSIFCEIFMKYLANFDSFSDFMKTWSFIYQGLLAHSLRHTDLDKIARERFLDVWSFVQKIPSDVFETIQKDSFCVSISDVEELLSGQLEYAVLKQREIDRSLKLCNEIFGEVMNHELHQYFVHWLMKRRNADIYTVKHIYVTLPEKRYYKDWKMVYFKYTTSIDGMSQFAILIVNTRHGVYYVVDYLEELCFPSEYRLNYIRRFTIRHKPTEYASIKIYMKDRRSIDMSEIESSDINQIIVHLKDVSYISISKVE